MLLRSGRATSPTIRRRGRGFSCGSSAVEAARRLVGLLPRKGYPALVGLLPRKGSPARRLKSRSPPASPEKQPLTPPSPGVPVGAAPPPAQYRSPGEDGSSRDSVEAENPPRVIKRSMDDEPSPTRRVKSRPPPEPLQKQLFALPPPEAGVGVAQHGSAGEDGTDDGSIAELGIKLFPRLPRDQAAALWVGFVNDAKTCIKQYNIKHKVNFVYKDERSNGFYRVEEQDDSVYYHMNFYAQDEYGHSQLFFGEIKECVRPQVEDVTCCCPVSSSDTGGVGFRTVEEALKYDFPDLSKVGYDAENCYACTARVKHPKGTLYFGGHFADVRQYYGF